MEDQKIIDLFWNRNEAAISSASKQYGRYCHSIAFRILHNEEDSAECVNDTWYQAWNTIPPTRPQYLSAFFGKITRNLAINTFKSGHTARRGGNMIAQPLEELEECLEASSNDVEEKIDEKLLRETLNHFLEQLPEKDRILFVRRYFYVDSVREIAQSMGMKESNVKVTLFRIREKLKSCLLKEGLV